MEYRTLSCPPCYRTVHLQCEENATNPVICMLVGRRGETGGILSQTEFWECHPALLCEPIWKRTDGTQYELDQCELDQYELEQCELDSVQIRNVIDHSTGANAALREDDFWTVVRGRRSVRRYRQQTIERGVLEALLEAARWAPSAHNRQPWRFAVVADPAAKERMSLRMGEQWRSDLQGDGADPAFIERRVAISHARMTSAGALIIASVSMEEMDTYTDSQRNEAEWLMAVQSVSLACQNLLLAAHAHGLGACWMCAPLFVPELVRNVLELPDHWHPQALITLGYPLPGHAAADKPAERKPQSSWVLWR